MGAWIEMQPLSLNTSSGTVALYMGAWIEMILRHRWTYISVALYMGAWIEISVLITLSS